MEKALQLNELAGRVAIRWRTFQLNPGMPREGMDRSSYLALKFGGAERAARVYEAIASAGETVGIPFQFDRISRTPNTIKAHRLIRRAGRSGLDGEVVESLFQRYFLKGQDIGSDDVLSDTAAECGVDGDDIREWLAGHEDEQEVRDEHDFAVSLNIDGVPCFVIDGHYAVVGAQEPEAFAPVFDLVREEERQAAES